MHRLKITIGLISLITLTLPLLAQDNSDITCEIVVAGGGLGGVAAALEALKLKHQVCMTEITDWIGGQVTSQGVSALDEDTVQRQDRLFPRAYQEFRHSIQVRTGAQNPGNCWVSQLCFSPQSAVAVLDEMLAPYLASKQLVLLKNTVIKNLALKNGQISALTVLTHLARGHDHNDLPLSYDFTDWYTTKPSARFDKKVRQLLPPPQRQTKLLPWIVIDATETGELLPLAGAPYRLGTDFRTRWEPSAAIAADPYCTQNFTYSLAIEQTNTAQLVSKPLAYDSPFNEPAYSFEKAEFTFPAIFTYRRIKGDIPVGPIPQAIPASALQVGDQSMQNWTWGNDWRLSTDTTNLVLTEQQLKQSGQLPEVMLFVFKQPGDWLGGLRVAALAQAEAHAAGYYYWLLNGTDDVLLQQQDPTYRKPRFSNYAWLKGKSSPLGTEHGLARYPYIREGRRLIGRPSYGYPEGFTIYESDLMGQGQSFVTPGQPRIYFDSVGVGQYRVDLHSCIINQKFDPSPGESRGKSINPRYPYQIPLRALIPQNIDNLLAGAKNIATTHITNAAYRVHPVEWAIGAAAGNTAAFALSHDLIPASLVITAPKSNPLLSALQKQIEHQGNPIRLP